MTIIIDAIKMCEDKVDKFSKDVKKIQDKINKQPEFIIINASDDEGNARYIKGKVLEGEKAGLKVTAIKLDQDCTDTEILEIINKCNTQKIPVILQLPTFKHINSKTLTEAIDYRVDADCFAKEWIGEINLGNDKSLAPATPKGVLSLLEYHNVEIEGRTALVVGKSNNVGKPICSMLMNRGATLINANSKTKDLASLVKISDIVISCVGKTDLINAQDVKDGAVLIGVGFTYIGRKQILDFDVEKVVEIGKAKYVSNRINCTGKATVSSLIDNVIELYKINFNIK